MSPPIKKLSFAARLVQSLHPPIPLTPKQTRALESAITKTFNNELNEEHGERGSSSHTNLHMGAILNSPHFAGPSRRPARSNSKKGAALNSMSLADLQNNIAQPWHRFSLQVASGEATLKSATQCLDECDSLYRQGLYTGEQKAGQVVANWLWSSGLEESFEFIHDSKFVQALVRQLYREGKQARINNWHHKLFSTSGGLTSESQSYGPYHNTHIQSLLVCHVRAENQLHGLDNALELFDTIREISIAGLGIEPQGLDSMWEQAHRRLLFPAGHWLLAQLVANPLAPKPLACNVHNYNKFKDGLETWTSSFRRLTMSALLSLSHPTDPSAKPAMEVINRLDPKRLDRSFFNTNRHQELIRLHVITAEWWYMRDQRQESAQVLRCLDDLWPTAENKPDHGSSVSTKLEWARTSLNIIQGNSQWKTEEST